MLVLSRKPGERVTIGEDIELEVLEIIGNRVRLGFTAPKDVAIHRKPPQVCRSCAFPAEANPCGLCRSDAEQRQDAILQAIRDERIGGA